MYLAHHELESEFIVITIYYHYFITQWLLLIAFTFYFCCYLSCNCGIQVTMRGTKQLLTASAQHSSEANTAKQQAALDMVHQLQQAILAMLTASQPDKAIVTPMQTSTDHTSPLAMTMLHEGDAENSTPEIGNVVKVQYQLVLDPATKQEASTDVGPEPGVQEGNSTNPDVHGSSMPPVFVSSK